MKKLAVVALGGNALLRYGQKGTFEEQLKNAEDTCNSLMTLIDDGYELIIGHGNGPQVGNVLLQHEAGHSVFSLEAMPMDFCVAETQGSIAYILEISMNNALKKKGADKRVLSLVTEVIVDKNDPMFLNPTKPVGPYYTKEQADEYSAKSGAIFKEDPKGNGWRKVVASPQPLQVNNIEIVKQLASAGNIVITVGGGGIPVCHEDDGTLKGVEAVIDKDLASSLAAVQSGAEKFIILTDVPNVYINFRKPDEVALGRVTVAELERYIEEGHFTAGSMLPKVRAALYFVKNGGKECLITEAGALSEGRGGTLIVQ